MRKFTTALFISLLLSTAANAQMVVTDPPKSSGPSWSYYNKLGSGYTFGDQGAIVCKNANDQASVNANWQSGWYGSVWVSENVATKSLTEDSCSEVDFTAGLERPLFGNVRYNFEVGYYFEPTVGKFRSDIIKLRGQLKQDYETNFGSIGWYAGVDHFVFRGKDTNVLRAGIPTTFTIGDGWSAGATPGFGYDTVGHSTVNYNVGLTKTFEDGSTLSPINVEGFIPLNPGRERLTVFSVQFVIHR